MPWLTQATGLHLVLLSGLNPRNRSPTSYVDPRLSRPDYPAAHERNSPPVVGYSSYARRFRGNLNRLETRVIVVSPRSSVKASPGTTSPLPRTARGEADPTYGTRKKGYEPSSQPHEVSHFPIPEPPGSIGWDEQMVVYSILVGFPKPMSSMKTVPGPPEAGLSRSPTPMTIVRTLLRLMPLNSAYGIGHPCQISRPATFPAVSPSAT